MYNKTMQETNYREKCQILKTVFNEYNKAKEKITFYPSVTSPPLFIRENTQNNYQYEHQLLHQLSQINHYREYITYIDEKLLYLNETEQMIIQHDFILQSSRRWWQLYFSSSTYYRHRKSAIERLFMLLFS